MYSFDEVKNADPELAKAMEQETGRQNDSGSSSPAIR